MSSGTELLVLRLGLIAVIFLFVFIVAMTMRSGVRVGVAPAPAAGPLRRTARFLVIFPGETGLATGAEFPIAGVMSIGRDGSNGIVLADPSVSTRHASIERSRDGWRVCDLGSTNGTTVDGRDIEGRAITLRGGERIGFGNVVLQFQP